MSELKEIGITTRKEVDFSEWYTQVVTKAGLIDYSPVKGFIVLKPYGYRIWEIITESLDKKLKESGHQNGGSSQDLRETARKNGRRVACDHDIDTRV